MFECLDCELAFDLPIFASILGQNEKEIDGLKRGAHAEILSFCNVSKKSLVSTMFHFVGSFLCVCVKKKEEGLLLIYCTTIMDGRMVCMVENEKKLEGTNEIHRALLKTTTSDIFAQQTHARTQ